MSDKTITIIIPGHPHAQGRPKATMRGRHAGVYKDKDSRIYEAKVAAIALTQLPDGWELIDQAITLTISFRLIRPKSVSAKKRPLPTVRPDLDNLIKSIKDGLNGIVWRDDCQIVSVTADKTYGDNPGATVIINY